MVVDTKRDFDQVMLDHGIRVPPDRRRGAKTVYEELLRMTALIHESADHGGEPAGVFHLGTVTHEWSK